MICREVDGQHVLSMHLTSIFSIMGGCKGDGPRFAVLGRSGGPCVRSWDVLVVSVSGLGPLEVLLVRSNFNTREFNTSKV